METNTTNISSGLRHASPDVWKPALDRITAPRWGAEERQAVDQVLGICRENLANNKRVMTTLAARYISPETVKHFQLGFADRHIGSELPRGETYEGARLRGRLQSVGLLRLSGHAHFDGSVVAPIMDINERVRDIYGRKITPRLRAGTAYHTCIYDPPQGVFNLRGLAGQRDVVLCNDLMDALTLHSAGVTSVSTTVGPRGFTDDHLRAFAAAGTKRVVLAFAAGTGQDRIARLIAQALGYMDIQSARMGAPSEVGNPRVLPDLVKAAPEFKQSAEELFKEVRQ